MLPVLLAVACVVCSQQNASAAKTKLNLYYWVVEVKYEDFEYGSTYWAERFRSDDEQEAREYYVFLRVAEELGYLTYIVGQPHPRYSPVDIRLRQKSRYATEFYWSYGGARFGY